MRPDAPREADRPIGELLRELGDEISTLIRQEIALAKVELAEKAKPAAASVGMFGAGALLALGAFGAFTTFLVALLAAGKLGDTAETLDRLEHSTSSVRNTVQETLGNAVGNVADKLPAPQDLRNAARRGVGIAVENPLGLALGALAVGFLAGLAAPVSDLEREKVGPLRDQLVERAKSAGADALESGKQMLQESAQAAMQHVMGQENGGTA